MNKLKFLGLLLFIQTSFAQQSDFSHINFTKADNIARKYKSKRLLELNKITYDLTKDLKTDVEKLRAIYYWITHNVANDFNLYTLNERKRSCYIKDSIKLQNWNSKFKKKLFKKLLRKKKTICTGYAYLLKEMATIAGLESKMVNGIGRTSSVDIESISMPNHTWNVVKLNNKWYLCDPTWSTGISFPEEGRFEFKYNNGYFLTDPKLFYQNHYPIESKFTLLENHNSSFSSFVELPLLYGDAFNYIKEPLAPIKMYHEIKQNSKFTFQYKLSKKVDKKNVKLVYFVGDDEKKLKSEIHIIDSVLTVNHTFRKKRYYDVHVFINNKIIATYTINVVKEKK